MKKMNKAVKIILSLALGVLVFLFLVLGVLLLSLDSIIKKGITTFGSQMTGVKVEVSTVSLSLLSSKLEITGLLVGNPQDYSSSDAFRMQRLYVSLDRNSIFTDKIIVHQITIEGAKINFEPKMNGENNLSAIQKTINKQRIQKDKNTAEPQPEQASAAKKSSKKVVIELFELKNAQIAVSSSLFQGNSINMQLPEIIIRDIGKNEDTTTAQAFEQVFKGVFKGVSDAVIGASDAVPFKEGLNKAQDGAKDAVEKTSESGKKIINGIKSLF